MRVLLGNEKKPITSTSADIMQDWPFLFQVHKFYIAISILLYKPLPASKGKKNWKAERFSVDGPKAERT